MQTCQLPFLQYYFHFQIEDAVLTGERPSIPDSCREDYKQLITACWSADPTERPSFSEILANLTLVYDTLRCSTDFKPPAQTEENRETPKRETFEIE
jgi:hypothetical protein